MASKYFKDLVEANQVLADMITQKEVLEVEIARQKRKVAALAELCNTGDDSDVTVELDLGGLTEACTTVLRGSRKEWLNTGEIQSALKELGFPIHTYKAANASIATTVNRLVEEGVVVSDKRLGAAAIEYKWVGRRPTLGERIAGKPLYDDVGRKLKADAALKETREEMRKSGSEVGDPLSLETPPARSLRPQERFNLKHTKGK